MLKKTTLGLIVLTAIPGFAAEKLDSIEVEELAERPSDEVITGKTIEKTSPTDMRALFKDSQSVTVGGGTASGQKLYMRGVEDVNLNVQVDGARQGGYLFHHQGNLFLEPELIKSVDIRPGVARADDGFGVLGGSVLVKTKNVFDFGTPEHRHGGFVKGTYYSNQNYIRPTLALYSMPTDKLGFLVLGTYKNGADYENGDGKKVVQTADKQISGLIKVSGRGDNFTYDIGHERVFDEGIRDPRQNFGHDPVDVATRQASQRDTISANGVYSFNPKYANIEGNVYHSQSKLRRESATPGNPDSKTYATSVGGAVSNSMDLKTLRMKYGVDYYESWSDAANGKEEENNKGVFLQNRYTVIDNLNFDFGARFDQHEFTNVLKKDFTNERFSPNIRGEFCKYGACLFAGYSESLRGIRPVEAVLATDTMIYPDGIKPETSATNEIGGTYGIKEHKFKVVVFRTDIKDFVTYNRTTKIRDNAGTLRTEGYEASYLYTNPKIVNAKLAYTKVRPSFDGDEILNQQMGVATSLGDTWMLTLSRTWDKYRLSYGMTAKVVETLDMDTKKPGYQTYDLWVDWLPTASNDLKLGLYVSNIFAENYVDHGTFVATGAREPLWAPGRDIRLSASYNF